MFGFLESSESLRDIYIFSRFPVSVELPVALSVVKKPSRQRTASLSFGLQNSEKSRLTPTNPNTRIPSNASRDIAPV